MAAIALVGTGSGTAFANHRPCELAGGLGIDDIGPTGADGCVLVSNDGVMVGADVINTCSLTGGCTTVGAHVYDTSTRNDACVGATVNNTPLVASCVFIP